MEFLAAHIDWEQWLLWAGALSLVTIVVTVAAVPLVVARLPTDYFSRRRRTALGMTPQAPLYRLLLTVLKNVLGVLLVTLGLLMLVTPGQGLLTLLAGLLLMNFPGKYWLERWLVTRPGALRGLNWLRRRQGRPPLQPPENLSAH